MKKLFILLAFVITVFAIHGCQSKTEAVQNADCNNIPPLEPAACKLGAEQSLCKMNSFCPINSIFQGGGKNVIDGYYESATDAPPSGYLVISERGKTCKMGTGDYSSIVFPQVVYNVNGEWVSRYYQGSAKLEPEKNDINFTVSQTPLDAGIKGAQAGQYTVWWNYADTTLNVYSIADKTTVGIVVKHSYCDAAVYGRLIVLSCQDDRTDDFPLKVNHFFDADALPQLVELGAAADIDIRTDFQTGCAFWKNVLYCRSVKTLVRFQFDFAVKTYAELETPVIDCLEMFLNSGRLFVAAWNNTVSVYDLAAPNFIPAATLDVKADILAIVGKSLLIKRYIAGSNSGGDYDYGEYSPSTCSDTEFFLTDISGCLPPQSKGLQCCDKADASTCDNGLDDEIGACRDNQCK